MERVRIGCIGMGKRGVSMLRTILNMCKNTQVVAVCDLYEDRAKKAGEMVQEKTGMLPLVTQDPQAVIQKEDVDAILIFAAWESHVDLAVSAMEHGKYVGLEVGGAYAIHDCYRLIEAYEKTKMPCMMLENCCYGRTELAILNMVRQGVLGEIVHCSGGYLHDLRYEIAGGVQDRHYRLRNYLTRNCENYPTHELGPICKVLNINRGNRMLTLSSFASKSKGLAAYAQENLDKYPNLEGANFAQGDIVTTVITCADGATIVLTLDTTLPRAYSRGFTVRGTKGGYFEDMDSVFMNNQAGDHLDKKNYWDNAEPYRRQYQHKLWEKYGEKAKEAGHDGMDYMVLSAFFEAVEKKTDTPIDTYDTATWMSITPLSEQSIAQGGVPVAIPDFTHGKWVTYEKPETENEFALD